MSSSNRAAGVCDAVLMHKEEIVGPLRLPVNRIDDFISHFNRVYASLGMSLVLDPRVPEELEPADREPAEYEPTEYEPAEWGNASGRTRVRQKKILGDSRVTEDS